MRRRAGRNRGSVGGRAGRKEKNVGDIRRMTEELWKWYDGFTKRLHVLILVKHCIDIASGMFKRVTAVDSQYEFTNKTEFSYRKHKSCIERERENEYSTSKQNKRETAS